MCKMNIIFLPDMVILTNGTQNKGLYSYELQLTIQQRIILAITAIILVLFAAIGNIATLYVAIRRKNIRPLFRTCLISLACSDLMDSTVSGVNDLTQFFAPFPQIWYLGPAMCTTMPFLSIIAIVVNSLTLVGISFDRYLSIKRIIKSSWEPSVRTCWILAIGFWGISVAIASPSIKAYKYVKLFIFVRGDNATDIVAVIPGHMCGATKAANAHYFTLIFCVLFVPMILTFLWFNSVLAIEVWSRRRTIGHTPPFQTTSTVATQKSTSNLNQIDQPDANTTDTALKPARSISEVRQLKSFYVILLLMIAFLIFKTPSWVYLILTFYNDYKLNDSLIVQYTLCLLSIGNSVFNPLLYAFLTQTVDYLIDVYQTTRKFLIKWFVCFMLAMSSVVVVESTETSENEIQSES